MTTRECRICHDTHNTTIHRLFAPCACSGSMRYVHRTCLADWRRISPVSLHSKQCEICKTPYTFVPFQWLQSIRQVVALLRAMVQTNAPKILLLFSLWLCAIVVSVVWQPDILGYHAFPVDTAKGLYEFPETLVCRDRDDDDRWVTVPVRFDTKTAATPLTRYSKFYVYSWQSFALTCMGIGIIEAAALMTRGWRTWWIDSDSNVSRRMRVCHVAVTIVLMVSVYFVYSVSVPCKQTHHCQCQPAFFSNTTTLVSLVSDGCRYSTLTYMRWCYTPTIGKCRCPIDQHSYIVEVIACIMGLDFLFFLFVRVLGAVTQTVLRDHSILRGDVVPL